MWEWVGPGTRRRKALVEFLLSDHAPFFPAWQTCKNLLGLAQEERWLSHRALLDPSCGPCGCHGDGSLLLPHDVRWLTAPPVTCLGWPRPLGCETLVSPIPFLFCSCLGHSKWQGLGILGSPFAGFMTDGKLRGDSGGPLHCLGSSTGPKASSQLRLTARSTDLGLQWNLAEESQFSFLMPFACGK